MGPTLTDPCLASAPALARRRLMGHRRGTRPRAWGPQWTPMDPHLNSVRHTCPALSTTTACGYLLIGHGVQHPNANAPDDVHLEHDGEQQRVLVEHGQRAHHRRAHRHRNHEQQAGRGHPILCPIESADSSVPMFMKILKNSR